MALNTNLSSINAEEENGREKPFSPIMTASRIMALLVLIAVACPNHGEAKSRKSLENFGQTEFEEKPFHDFSNLVDADWEEIEEKLGVVSLDEFKKMLKSLGTVATDSRILRESGIRKSLVEGNLDKSQRETLLDLARKYKLDTVPTIKKILDDDKISPRNIKFLEGQYSALIHRFIDVCDKYIKIREWMFGKGQIDANDGKLNAFRALKEDLKKRLSGNSGNTSSINKSKFNPFSLDISNNTGKRTPLLTSFGRHDGKSVGRVRM